MMLNPGNNCGCCTACQILITTQWCPGVKTCVPKTTITITIFNNTLGQVDTIAQADPTTGSYLWTAATPGTYIISASAAGYANLSVTTTVTISPCAPAVVNTPLFPVSLTLTDQQIGVEVTLLPTAGVLPANFIYIGNTTYNWEGGCGCGAAEVLLQYALTICATPPAQLDISVGLTGFPLEPCPGVGPLLGTGLGGNYAATGSGPGIGATCYPVNITIAFSGMNFNGVSVGSALAEVYGSCEPPPTTLPASYLVTQ